MRAPSEVSPLEHAFPEAGTSRGSTQRKARHPRAGGTRRWEVLSQGELRSVHDAYGKGAALLRLF